MPLQVLHVLRALEYKAEDERVVVLNEMDDRIGQEPFKSPSVFNFYLPEYHPRGKNHPSNMFTQAFMHTDTHARLPAKSVIYFY